MHRYLLVLTLCVLGYHQAIPTSACFETERKALLAFKAGVIDAGNRLSSWAGRDCCSWNGVACDDNTGHAVKLNLRNNYMDQDYMNSSLYELRGEIDPSLIVLHHLVHLDLSGNYFAGSTVPEFIRSFNNLTHLDLSFCEFSGRIPQQLGDLFNLRFLDLSWSGLFVGAPPPWLGNLSHLRALGLEDAFPFNGPNVCDLSWLSRLSSLRYLAMSWVNLSGAADWLQHVNKLKYITELSLEGCSLSNIPYSLSHVNFTSLRILKLGGNGPFDVPVPAWLSNLTDLSYLGLESCGFHGKIPDSLGNLTSLNNLFLGDNHFDGTMPKSLRNLCNLRGVDLSSLRIGGDIALVVETFRCTWKSLEILDLSNNELRGNLSSWLEQLENVSMVNLSNNSLAGTIPFGIRNLSNLGWLELSLNSLQGVVSKAHFANLSNLEAILLSSNSLVIDIDENWVPPFQLTFLMLGSCELGSRFPAWLRWQTQLRDVDLSNTSISGTVPEWFWNSSALMVVDLSYNQLVGELPISLQFTNLEYLVLRSNRIEGPMPLSLPNRLSILDLSENSLSGPLPLSLDMCDLEDLMVLDLSMNNLSGEIPASIGLLSFLTSLHLNDNRFHGEIPTSLQHCTNLILLDLSRNRFSGEIPAWVGESLQNLVFVQLRSNTFSGDIPDMLARLPYLHVLDLAHNNLSGPVPRSFRNFSAMIRPLADNYIRNGYKISLNTDILFDFRDNLLLIMKGNEFQYSTILYLVKTIDLSGNNLSGQIPEEIAALHLLQSLNLSANHLTGRIPEKIGDMHYLESLDLSLNELSGAIPQSLSDLTFLSHLNLSYNNLSGRIPTGSQLGRLNDPSIYTGNYYLCGPPTDHNCSKDDANPYPKRDDYNKTETIWLYLGMVLGFIAGFWSVKGLQDQINLQFLVHFQAKLLKLLELFIGEENEKVISWRLAKNSISKNSAGKHAIIKPSQQAHDSRPKGRRSSPSKPALSTPATACLHGQVGTAAVGTE
ncbi:LRR receptor-like serine/threonine-protein kinase GSO1 [Ananas comosus]|uniref:LRR receptor-like serine/threonine-protein kinase GSO1 n=1 Tax=Ananas comosus TaxID=4615 RepID=A0A199USF4_ANACO|nr:LRR receptor-like serine/threonine-protein kinase GSO1 [Ananas comosus]